MKANKETPVQEFLCQKEGFESRKFTMQQLEAMGTDLGGDSYDGWRIAEPIRIPDEVLQAQGKGKIVGSLKANGYQSDEASSMGISGGKGDKGVPGLPSEDDQPPYTRFPIEHWHPDYVNLKAENETLKAMGEKLLEHWKQENEQLKTENESLKQQIAQLIADLETQAEQTSEDFDLETKEVQQILADVQKKRDAEETEPGKPAKTTKKVTKKEEDSHGNIAKTENSGERDDSDPDSVSSKDSAPSAIGDEKTD